MVFITFPKELTEEEKMLQQKYAKLQRKKKQLMDLRAPKVEPTPVPVPVVKKHDGPKADPKEVAKKLLKSGVIAPIKMLPSNATSGFKRKRMGSDRPGGDRPGGYQPFSSGNIKMEDEEDGGLIGNSVPSDPNPLPRAPGDRYRDLYDNFVSAKDVESIAREEAIREKKRDRAHYVNRDNPNQGNTVYVKGVGLSENLLKQPMSTFGSILNLIVEEEKNCAFVTFETIDEANRAIDEMNNRTIDGIKVQVSMAKRQLHLPKKGSNSSSPGSDPGSGTPSHPGHGNTNSWSMIAANFSSSNVSGKQGFGTSIKKEGIKSGTRELVVYEDDIPDD